MACAQERLRRRFPGSDSCWSTRGRGGAIQARAIEFSAERTGEAMDADAFASSLGRNAGAVREPGRIRPSGALTILGRIDCSYSRFKVTPPFVVLT
jgi:hypothetical protein